MSRMSGRATTRIVRRTSLAAVLGVMLVASAHAQDVIKVGAILSLSGPFSSTETPLKSMLDFLIDAQNRKGGLLGKRLELVVRDAQSKPDVSGVSAAELTAKDKVDVVFGGVSTPLLLGALPIFRQTDTILISPREDAGGPTRPNIFYTGPTLDELARPAIGHLQQTFRPQRWILIGWDGTHSRAAHRRFGEFLQAVSANAQISSVFARVDDGDWPSTVVAGIRPPGQSPANTVILSTFGESETERLVRALGEAGALLPGNVVPILSLNGGNFLNFLSPPTIDHRISRAYFPLADTPANREFVDKWRRFSNGRLPVTDAMENYVIGFSMWVDAVQRAGTTESAKVVDKLKGAKMATLAGGQAEMSADGRMTRPVFVTKVRSNGELEAILRSPSEQSVSVSPDKFPFIGSTNVAPPPLPRTSIPPIPIPIPSPGPPPPSSQPVTHQTAPGQGASGTVALGSAGPSSSGPSQSNPSADSAAPKGGDASSGPPSEGRPADQGPLPKPPIRPIPKMSGTPPVCSLPESRQPLSPEDFAQLQRSNLNPDGSVAITYCRGGFEDVLLLDTLERADQPSTNVCSAVRIAANWVLTAKHCVKNWNEKSGRIFQLASGSAECLDTLTKEQLRHPGDECKLSRVVRNGPPIADLNISDKEVDIALVPVERPKGAPPRFATVRKFDLSEPIEVTLAGFGASPDGGMAGRLRVGWSKIAEKTILTAMLTGEREGRTLASVPIVFRTRLYQKDTLASWACRGDSGAPVLAGRVFGYSDEPHWVSGIIVRSSFLEEARCKPDAPVEEDRAEVVSLMDEKVQAWLCKHTGDILDICK